MGKNIRGNFDIILEEMFGSDDMCFDTLLASTEKDALHKVRHWCRRYEIDYGEAYQDITQIVMIRVFKKCVPQFFCRNGIENLNTSAEEYWRWVQSICQTCAYSYAKKLYKRELKEMPEDENAIAPEAKEVDTEKLCRAFNTVMCAGGNVYKTLTWLAQSLLVLQNNETRIESNENLMRLFDNMTLDEMFSFLLKASDRFDWLKLDEAGVEKVRKGLDKFHESGERMGNMKYSEFYMAKGPKSTISDWINRMDGKIIENEEKNKKKDKEESNKK